MKMLLSLLFLFSMIDFDKQVLFDYHDLNSEKSELAFIEKYKSHSSNTVKGYVCSIAMKQARYSYNPMRKLTIFKEQKIVLESLIKNEPGNVHLRYVRYFVQLNTPSMLKYNGQLTADKKILAAYIKKNNEQDLLYQLIIKNCQL